MDLILRTAIAQAINGNPHADLVISAIEMAADGVGTITYNSANTWVDPAAPGFHASTAPITDEEMVRAYLLTRLVGTYEYPATQQTLEVERVYKPVGRPIGKGGRVDVLVRRPGDVDPGEAFLFIECKAPNKFDEDLKYLDGQLFRLSRQEATRPRFLVYYTVDYKANSLKERLILIDTEAFPDYAAWDRAGQPITDAIPKRYGLAQKRRYANVATESERSRPLDKESTPATFHRLRTEIHDVIWAGGGTNNNEVFVLIIRVILCKIFDEKETSPNETYRFQRLGDALSPEPSVKLVERMNGLYREAESSYLALPIASAGPAFDVTRIAPEKIAYVVGRLEGISITENLHSGDLLGEFFEQIIAQDFTQTKGQFFTPVKLIRFMLHLSDSVNKAYNVMIQKRDHLGRPRLPYVIDPSCGSGTFLIEYMKLIRRGLGSDSVAMSLPNRIREVHSGWFGGTTGNGWARDFLFGIENNYDLGLAAKVNMVLHGDGSMNTWIKSGLAPFEDYWIDGRNNVLGISQPEINHPYGAERNEQFDFILSNPPFSIKLSPDEKTKIAEAFEVMASAQSEAIFIERWYQLLREGGSFCCILPEAILDTSTFSLIRSFIIRMFKVEAIISLPYDAFRPFTSTKTCILYATKRKSAEVKAFDKSLERHRSSRPSDTLNNLSKTLDELGWADTPIFMAEPPSIGYKRRKNLPDLSQPNFLYHEDSAGDLAEINTEDPSTVLDSYFSGTEHSPNSTIGFWTSLRNITKRQGMRLDPKYRWLWDFQKGLVHGNPDRAVELSTFLSLVDLPKVAKGELEQEASLVDLEYVESRQALVRDDVPIVDVVGSDKVRFENCDLLFSKLEPYLAKIIISPIREHLGSTEWVGLRVTKPLPLNLVAYLLMLPELCEAYRRLQSGKRHARLDPKEFLGLKVEVPSDMDTIALSKAIARSRQLIIDNRLEERDIRASIDGLFD